MSSTSHDMYYIFCSNTRKSRVLVAHGNVCGGSRPWVRLLVAPDDNDHKGPGLGHRTTGCSRFLFLKFSCGQIHPMRLGVKVHCLGADRSSHCLHDVELARRTLARNVKLAVSAAGERLMTVELRSIHASADRQIREHLAVVRAHHNQLLRISTSNKKSPFRFVDR